MDDLLTNDLASMDTSFPLINGGLYDLQCNKVEVMTNDARTVKLELATTAVTKSNKGEELPIGTKIFAQVNTKPTGKLLNRPDGLKIVGQGVAKLVQAAKLSSSDLGGGSGQQQLDNVPFWAPMIAGRILRSRVIIEPESNKDGKYYPARNTVVEFVKS